MANIETILALHRRDWSIRRIASVRGFHPDAVARPLRQPVGHGGAQAVQMVCALLMQGAAYLDKERRDLARWLEEHEYDSMQQMRGSMSLLRCDNLRAYERVNYITILQSWTQ